MFLAPASALPLSTIITQCHLWTAVLAPSRGFLSEWCTRTIFSALVLHLECCLEWCTLTTAPPAQVFAKIESIAGLTNHEDILDAADGLVFSRGNLGVQLAPEKTILAQHLLLGAANLRGKPVFVTRLCDSMVEVPRPTRAEATDVANLVLNGADGVILGQETFRGLYPVACATTVMRICDQAERHVNSHMHYLKLMAESGTYVGKRLDYRESLASTAVRAVEKLDAKLIVCFTGCVREPPLPALCVAPYTPLPVPATRKQHLRTPPTRKPNRRITLPPQPRFGFATYSDPSQPGKEGKSTFIWKHIRMRREYNTARGHRDSIPKTI